MELHIQPVSYTHLDVYKRQTIAISVTPPTITALSITTPGAVTAPNVVSPNIKPVDFAIDPAGDSASYKRTSRCV